MLQIESISKYYGKHLALEHFSLTAAAGETVVIMGPSGCGKSTAIRCVNRLVEPDAGDIRVNGQSVLALSDSELRQLRQRVGVVFQQFNLIQRLTVLENVIFHLVLGGVHRDQAEVFGRQALAKVGLTGCEQRRPDQLSGGQQQRVGIARALAGNPQLMLWDEPTASLDPILVGEVLDVMEDLVCKTNTTMVIVTHEVSFALRTADRIVLMNRGRVVEEGQPQELFDHPRSDIGQKYQRLLIG